jgi:hypothetical protein
MRKIILFVASIAIVLLSITAYFILNSPARELTSKEKEKALTQIVGRKLNLTGKDIPTGNLLHKGKYASFSYPAAAKIYRQMLNGKEAENTGALESFMFDLESPKVYVVTEVIKAPSTTVNLSDYPSVSLRQTQKDQYSQVIVQVSDGTSGLGFNKTGDTGFEKTMFFLVKGKIYSFSITSVDRQVEEGIAGKILSTLKFYN